MSATLRYQISERACDAIAAGLLTDFAPSQGRHWAGVRRGHRPVFRFSIRLPGQVAAAHRLLGFLAWQCLKCEGGLTRLSLRTLLGKLNMALGLPPSDVTGQEAAFVSAIQEAPADLSNWMAYADWLWEAGCPRGRLIAGWLDPRRPLAVKGGVPLLARASGKVTV